MSFQWDSDLEDSDDDEDDYVAPKKPKPKAALNKKSPPKKQLISVGNAESGPKKVNKLSKSKTVDSKAFPKKKPKPVPKGNVEPDDKDDIFEEDESTGEPTAMSRSRRSHANVSYTVDGSSDEEIDEEPGDDEMEDDIVNIKATKQSNMLVDDVSLLLRLAHDSIHSTLSHMHLPAKPLSRIKWGFDDEMDTDDDKPVPEKAAPKSSVGSKKKSTSKLSKPDPSRVFKSLAVDLDDDLVDSQSFGSPSPIKKKPSKATQKAAPKTKSSPPTKAKLPKKNVATKKKLSKSVCDLSSDEDDFLDEGSVENYADSVESDGTGDLIMQDIGPKSSGRRSVGRCHTKMRNLSRKKS